MLLEVAGWLCKMNRGPQAASSRQMQKFGKFSNQKFRMLGNAQDGVDPHPAVLLEMVSRIKLVISQPSLHMQEKRDC